MSADNWGRQFSKHEIDITWRDLMKSWMTLPHVGGPTESLPHGHCCFHSMWVSSFFPPTATDSSPSTTILSTVIYSSPAPSLLQQQPAAHLAPPSSPTSSPPHHHRHLLLHTSHPDVTSGEAATATAVAPALKQPAPDASFGHHRPPFPTPSPQGEPPRPPLPGGSIRAGQSRPQFIIIIPSLGYQARIRSVINTRRFDVYYRAVDNISAEMTVKRIETTTDFVESGKLKKKKLRQTCPPGIIGEDPRFFIHTFPALLDPDSLLPIACSFHQRFSLCLVVVCV
uniref:Uncharacterized protein n=1 Tax=Salix viminalis TaxID=40686 RepID=A0A6N2LCF3_SALVM